MQLLDAVSSPPQPEAPLFRWLRASVPHSLIELAGSEGDSAFFSRQLVEEGWQRLLLRESVEDLPRKLAGAGIPQNFGLLVVHNPKLTVGFVEELQQLQFRPAVIARCDEQPIAQRAGIYAQLVAKGYRFAGVELGFSIWTEVPVPAEAQPPSSITLPDNIEERFARAYFDGSDTPQDFSTASPIDLPVTGWAFVDLEPPILPPVYIEATDVRTGERDYAAAIRCERADVAEHYHNPALLMAGFQAVVPIRRPYPNGLRLRIFQCDDQTCYSSPAQLVLEAGTEEFERVAREGLAHKFLRGSGIEIGALQRKLPLPPICAVRYLDRMPVEDLTRHYPELEGLPLQAPDLIDDGERLDTIAEGSLDFVVANHFFEHSENPIQTLENLLRVLKPAGVLFMAVPDKRYTFDAERPSTAFATLRATYKTGVRPDRFELYREWTQLSEMNKTAWEDRFNCLVNENYSIHFNVWSADELLGFLIEARQEFHLPFHILSTVCSENETIVLLARTAAPVVSKRAEEPAPAQPVPVLPAPVVAAKRNTALIQVFPFNPTGYVERDAVSARIQLDCWNTLTFDLPPGGLRGPIRIDPADMPCVVDIGEFQIVDSTTKRTLVRLREPAELREQVRILKWATFLSASSHSLLFCSADDPQLEFTYNGNFDGAVQVMLLIRVERGFELLSSELEEMERRTEEKIQTELGSIRTELRAAQASRNLLATQISQLTMEKNSALREKQEELKLLREKLAEQAAQIEKCAEKQRELQSLEAQLAAHKEALAGVQHSISWRITKPMRGVMSILRGRGHGSSGRTA